MITIAHKIIDLKKKDLQLREKLMREGKLSLRIKLKSWGPKNGVSVFLLCIFKISKPGSRGFNGYLMPNALRLNIFPAARPYYWIIFSIAIKWLLLIMLSLAIISIIRYGKTDFYHHLHRQAWQPDRLQA
ncbi:hypothetical protein HHL17_24450 [Chitinophaga sp. G-6-1-13]|uniref:Uncharacterized protein n=1 Tax=Chitinophaga fulva TaxID=2728842 RepID=A0A848GS89_9BACT|nr:hypothetical protein [Chitinophaga fulva]NML40371.1 hypothetical protein [Chitinophaga fulva]